MPCFSLRNAHTYQASLRRNCNDILLVPHHTPLCWTERCSPLAVRSHSIHTRLYPSFRCRVFVGGIPLFAFRHVKHCYSPANCVASPYLRQYSKFKIADVFFLPLPSARRFAQRCSTGYFFLHVVLFETQARHNLGKNPSLPRPFRLGALVERRTSNR